MLPCRSTTGFDTGCMLSATRCRRRRSRGAECCSFPTMNHCADGALRHAHDHERIRADHHRRGHVAEADIGSRVRGQALAADLKFAAGNRRGGRDLENLRAGIVGFTKCHCCI